MKIFIWIVIKQTRVGNGEDVFYVLLRLFQQSKHVTHLNKYNFILRRRKLFYNVQFYISWMCACSLFFFLLECSVVMAAFVVHDCQWLIFSRFQTHSSGKHFLNFSLLLSRSIISPEIKPPVSAEHGFSYFVVFISRRQTCTWKTWCKMWWTSRKNPTLLEPFKYTDLNGTFKCLIYTLNKNIQTTFYIKS